MDNNKMLIEFIRQPAVTAMTGLSRSVLYAHVQRGLFTPPIHLGPQTAVWPRHEINAINAARLASKSEDEIREVVKAMIADRGRQ